MSDTIYKFKDLPISFEYLYQQVVAMSIENYSMRHLDELPLLAEKLHLSPSETLVFALVFHCQDKKTPITQSGLSRLASKFIGSKGEVDDIVELFKKLECFDVAGPWNNEVIKIKSSFFKAVRKNELKRLAEIKPAGLEALLEYFSNKLLDSDFLDLSTIKEEIDFMSEVNPELAIIKKCFKKSPPYDAYLVGAVCAKFYLSNEPFETSYFKLYMRGSNDVVKSKIRKIIDGSWNPIQLGWIKATGEGLVNDDVQLELTPTGVRNLLPELSKESLEELELRTSRLPDSAILPESIKKIKLYFDEKTKRQIDDLERLVMPALFKTYQSSLDEVNRMRGLTVLLHGGPGTGKTELALQLARKSKRALFQLNVTQVMSKWVGESEQNLKKIFFEYNRYLRNNAIEPILFLNECDGLLGKRVDVVRSVDQMNNALQNIFLEEMENFKGILIATTNMTQNLDAAFERRFLYKVRFDKPGAALTELLWKQFIPALKKEQLRHIALHFPFSPGEMQNVAQKLNIRQLLSKGRLAFDLVQELCREEKLNGNNRIRLGFNQN